jgi:hypothetical protein
MGLPPVERCLASSAAKAKEDKCEADAVGTLEGSRFGPRFHEPANFVLSPDTTTEQRSGRLPGTADRFAIVSKPQPIPQNQRAD